ncbi:Hypothetical predicted protein [Octopus vulgaris]|uniref:SCAN domain-containing protein 3-like n=1 Tax=Octopus vulgaris TaxID=6645 RepID=A0AA36FA51_OCTVU|nr:Hypothetical predicted protein [Octopus vulgaris]
MHRTTRGDYLFHMVDSALKDFDLPYDKMSGLATDDTPSMVGREKGFVTVIRNEFKKRLLDPETLCHRFVHMEILCAKSSKMGNVMKIVTKAVNLIKSKGLNNREFKEFLKNLEAEYGDLLYHCKIKWLKSIAYAQSICQKFKQAIDTLKEYPASGKYSTDDIISHHKRLIPVGSHERSCNPSTAEKVAVITVVDDTNNPNIKPVYNASNEKLDYISQIHKGYGLLHYLLLFPYGEEGWNALLKDNAGSKAITECDLFLSAPDKKGRVQRHNEK